MNICTEAATSNSIERTLDDEISTGNNGDEITNVMFDFVDVNMV